MVLEGLDTIPLTLKDVATSPNQEDLRILTALTSGEGGGMSKIRGRYLDIEQKLTPATKALMVSATGHMDQLKEFFGTLGKSYERLAAVRS